MAGPCGDRGPARLRPWDSVVGGRPAASAGPPAPGLAGLRPGFLRRACGAGDTAKPGGGLPASESFRVEEGLARAGVAGKLAATW